MPPEYRLPGVFFIGMACLCVLVILEIISWVLIERRDSEEKDD